MQDDSTIGNRPLTSVPWTGTEIALSVFLAWFFWPGAVYFALKGLGIEHWYYGDDTPERAKRLGLWVGTFAAPLQILTYPLVFSAYSRTTLDQLGLTTRRWGRNVLAGVAGLLLLGPVVFGVWTLVRFLTETASGQEIQEHALETLAHQQLAPTEWGMVFFTAMIAAPLHEELTFRGVLQPWLATRRWGGLAALLAALVITIAFRAERLMSAWPEGLSAVLLAAAPTLFVLALVPLYLVVWSFSRTPAPSAIFGTAVVFACIHSSVWPTPIPLFVLALGLGVLARSTRSLVGPIVLHSLFNGVSCIQLVVEKIK